MDRKNIKNTIIYNVITFLAAIILNNYVFELDLKTVAAALFTGALISLYALLSDQMFLIDVYYLPESACLWSLGLYSHLIGNTEVEVPSTLIGTLGYFIIAAHIRYRKELKKEDNLE